LLIFPRENQFRRQLQKWNVTKYKTDSSDHPEVVGVELHEEQPDVCEDDTSTPNTSPSSSEPKYPQQHSSKRKGRESLPSVQREPKKQKLSGLKRSNAIRCSFGDTKSCVTFSTCTEKNTVLNRRQSFESISSTKELESLPDVGDQLTAAKLPELARSNTITVSNTGNLLPDQSSAHTNESTLPGRKTSLGSISSAKDRDEDFHASAGPMDITLEDSPRVEVSCQMQDVENMPEAALQHSSNVSSCEASDGSTPDQREQSLSTEQTPPTSSFPTPSKSTDLQQPLVVDLAGPCSSWLPKDMRKVHHAADLLFSCGLLEDAFALYVSLWKQLDASMTSTIMRHGVVLSCWRSSTTDLHRSIVDNMLEKELDQERESLSVHHVSPIYLRSFTSLFHLLRGQVALLQGAPRMISKTIRSVYKEFPTLNALVKSFFELRSRNFNVEEPDREHHAYPECWMAHSILPVTIELQPQPTHPSQKLQVFIDQKRVLLHHLPSVLTSAAFFDYDINGLLEWLREPLSVSMLRKAFTMRLKPLFRTHQSRPEIALACYLWEIWQTGELNERERGSLHQQYSARMTRSLPSYIGPRTVGLDSVSVAELLIVTSSLILTEKLSKVKSLFSKMFIEELSLPQVICDNYTKLTKLDKETLHQNFRNRHLLMIERQRQGPPAASGEALRKMVEQTLDIVLPVRNVPSSQSSSKNVSTFNSRLSVAQADPTLAESLNQSENSSFKRFAGCTKWPKSTPFSHLSPRSDFGGSKSYVAGLTKSCSYLIDEISVSCRTLSISDSVQIAILDFDRNHELNDEELSEISEKA
jgi:hypothetical protein